MLASIGLWISAALFATAAALLTAAAAARLLPATAGARGEEDPLSRGQRLRALLQRHLAPFCAKRIPAPYLLHLERELSRAGEPGRLAAQELVGLQLGGALLGGASGLLAGSALGMSGSFAAGGAFLGVTYPLLWLRETKQRRQREIARELPYSLDLLTLSVEAGLDFGGALAKVVDRQRRSSLRDELALVLKELRMGRSREEALRGLLDRTELAAIRSFVTALVQADRMGTSLGKVLRLQAGQLREKRSQRAEKLAGEAPVKILLPLIACIFPTIFLVLFGPIAFAMLWGNFGG